MKNPFEAPPKLDGVKEEKENEKKGSEEVVEIEADERASDPSRHGELFREKREKFQQMLEGADLALLAAMLEGFGKKKIEETEEFPESWKTEIKQARKNKKELMYPNPGLYFITAQECTNLAKREIRKRFEESGIEDKLKENSQDQAEDFEPENEKELELKGFYKEASDEMKKAAQEIKNSRQDMLAELTKKGSTYKEYKEHVLALDKLATSFEEGAKKFENEGKNVSVKNILKLLGCDLAKKVLGQAKEIVMSNVGRELSKLVNVDVLDSLLNQDGATGDAIIDLLVAGDIKKLLKGEDESKFDVDDLKKRIRDEIKEMLKKNKEDLRKNWKSKIAEIVNKKVEELKKEVGEYADKQEKTMEKSKDDEEKEKSSLCAGEAKPTSNECPAGYHFEPKSGVGCVQTNCKAGAISNAHLSYTGRCVCGSSGSINENPDDPNKECILPKECGPCPSCVYACVGVEEECPGY